MGLRVSPMIFEHDKQLHEKESKMDRPGVSEGGAMEQCYVPDSPWGIGIQTEEGKEPHANRSTHTPTSSPTRQPLHPHANLFTYTPTLSSTHNPFMKLITIFDMQNMRSVERGADCCVDCRMGFGVLCGVSYG